MLLQANVVTHLVKRGFHMKDEILIPGQPGKPGEDMPQLSGAATVTLVLTAIVGLVLLIMLQYTVKLLLTLAVVEEPPAVYLPLSTDTEAGEATSRPANDQRVFITSNIPGAIRYLRSEAGTWAPWRGFAPNLFFGIANGIVQGIFTAILAAILPWNPSVSGPDSDPNYSHHKGSLASFLAGILALASLSRFAMVCTHIMITAPSEQYWWDRLRKSQWSEAKKTIPAVLIWATAVQVAAEGTFITGSPTLAAHPGARIAIGFVNFLVYVCITIPATILLIRVQASVLEDEMPTIVSFDKTFGQDTSATNGVLTIKMAIKSFDRSLLKRLGILLLKTVPLCAVATAAFVAIMMGEFVLFSVPLNKAY